MQKFYSRARILLLVRALIKYYYIDHKAPESSAATNPNLRARMVRGIKRNHIQYYRVHVLAKRSKALTVRITEYHDNSLINYSPPESIVYRETVLRTTCNRCNHKRNQKLDENARMSLQLINNVIRLPSVSISTRRKLQRNVEINILSGKSSV